jgi:hypothetical protein
MRSAYERLSIRDECKLWAESPDTHMHILAVLQVEPGPFVGVNGRLKLDDIRRRIAHRLDRAPTIAAGGSAWQLLDRTPCVGR